MSFKNLMPLFLLSILIILGSCVPEEEVCKTNEDGKEVCTPAGSDDGSELDDDEEAQPTEPTPSPTPDPTPTSTPTPTPSPGEGTPHKPEPTETIETSFFSPWNKSMNSIVIDAYELNSIDWDQMARDGRTVGVIHRSSIGLRVDKKYISRKKIALERGYLWGAYHLGYTGNITAQVDLFLDLVGKGDDTLMILDLEDTTNGRFMTIAEAEKFMEIVFERTGKIPVVYANHSTTKLLNTRVKSNPLFLQSKLWYARFKSSVTDFPFGIWNNYFLWQFSSEINCSKTGNCLYNVPGTKYDMDVNVFYGSPGELGSRWHNF